MTSDLRAPRALLAALADQTRWQILVQLGESPSSASRLAEHLPVSRPAIIKHLKALVATGFVTSERQGKEVVYRVIGARLSALAKDLDAIGRAWDNRLARLKHRAEEPS